MPFVNHYQVIAFEALHGNGFVTVLVCQFVDIDDLDALATEHGTGILGKQLCLHVRLRQLI